jgi:heme-degrading monooxygenase HmoA
MFIASNRSSVKRGREGDFQRPWRNRGGTLDGAAFRHWVGSGAFAPVT